MALLKLTDNNDDPVWVNTAHVRALVQFAPGHGGSGWTKIDLGSAQPLIVQGSVDQIAALVAD